MSFKLKIEDRPIFVKTDKKFIPRRRSKRTLYGRKVVIVDKEKGREAMKRALICMNQPKSELCEAE